jgi:hypothetical protein
MAIVLIELGEDRWDAVYLANGLGGEEREREKKVQN